MFVSTLHVLFAFDCHLDTGFFTILWLFCQIFYEYLISRSPTPKRRSRHSPSTSPKRSPDRKSVEQNQGRASRSVLGHPAGRAPEPSTSNHGRVVSRSPSLDGAPKRIRKGRGFTEQYSFARRYRTPSPDRSPRSAYNYGGRNFHERNRDR